MYDISQKVQYQEEIQNVLHFMYFHLHSHNNEDDEYLF